MRLKIMSSSSVSLYARETDRYITQCHGAPSHSIKSPQSKDSRIYPTTTVRECIQQSRRVERVLFHCADVGTDPVLS